MTPTLKKNVGGNWFIITSIILLLTNLAILLNISFLRQVLGFLFLTLLPGLLLLQILKLNRIDSTEKFVLSVGLSISFLTFFGLFINNFSLNFNYLTPLTTIPLLIAFNLAFVVLWIVGYKINKAPIFSLPNLNLSALEKAFLIVPTLFPVLSIFGTNLMNTTGNNAVLMILLFLIPAYVVFICFFNQKIPERIYPVVIFLIGVSLVLVYALRTNHIMGYDINYEYYFFQTTLNNSHWSVFGHSTLDACLSISLLPTIYQSILNIYPEFLFKILYSLIYSISPLIVYILSAKYIGKSYAFLASCFFMFQFNFLLAEQNPRTNTAILFFALAMMTLFNDKIDPLRKRILFILFMASCLVSHYSTTYIFFFILLGVFIGMEILSKKYRVKKVVSLTMVFLFFAFVFFWYSQVTETAFNVGVSFIENTFANLNKFFIEESRGVGTGMLFGKGILQRGIPYLIELIFTWLTFALIAIGIITLVGRSKEMSFPELNFKKPDFLKDKFEVEYSVIVLICAGLLIVVIATPYIAVGYSLSRTYNIVLILLSTFSIIGGITLSKYLKVRAYLIILLILIPYFFCISGVTYQILGHPRAITLNSENYSECNSYVHDQEIYAAKWLKDYDGSKLRIYSDHFGGIRLISQGMLAPNLVDNSLLKRLSENKKIEGYIYLRYCNVVDGKLSGTDYLLLYNMTEYSDVFIKKNKIYANGGSEIYR